MTLVVIGKQEYYSEINRLKRRSAYQQTETANRYGHTLPHAHQGPMGYSHTNLQRPDHPSKKHPLGIRKYN